MLLNFRFSVDGIPIREFKNLESIGIPFPKKQPMKIYSSLWNADNWATRGGLVKIDWSNAPFHASYKNFNAISHSQDWLFDQVLDFARQGQMQWVRDNYMIYDYCKDYPRFPLGLPSECYVSNWFVSKLWLKPSSCFVFSFMLQFTHCLHHFIELLYLIDICIINFFSGLNSRYICYKYNIWFCNESSIYIKMYFFLKFKGNLSKCNYFGLKVEPC